VAEIWVTPLACSECHSLYHDDDPDDDIGYLCDCWCHEEGAEDWDLG
jgi:hypothetical protein